MDKAHRVNAGLYRRLQAIIAVISKAKRVLKQKLEPVLVIQKTADKGAFLQADGHKAADVLKRAGDSYSSQHHGQYDSGGNQHRLSDRSVPDKNNDEVQQAENKNCPTAGQQNACKQCQHFCTSGSGLFFLIAKDNHTQQQIEGKGVGILEKPAQTAIVIKIIGQRRYKPRDGRERQHRHARIRNNLQALLHGFFFKLKQQEQKEHDRQHLEKPRQRHPSVHGIQRRDQIKKVGSR